MSFLDNHIKTGVLLMNKLDTLSRCLIESHIRDELKNLTTDREKAMRLGELIKSFDPSDITHFTKLLINNPLPQEHTPVNPQTVRVHPVDFNDSAPTQDQKVKWGIGTPIPKPPVKQAGLKKSSKPWRNSTKAKINTITYAASAYPPQMGGKKTLLRWLKRVLRFNRFSGKELILHSDGTSKPPLFLRVTAAFNVLGYLEQKKKSRAIMYRVYICLDQTSGLIQTVWSRYPEQESHEIYPEVWVILKNGHEITQIGFNV